MVAIYNLAAFASAAYALPESDKFPLSEAFRYCAIGEAGVPSFVPFNETKIPRAQYAPHSTLRMVVC
jgi:hypothetical protein